MFGAHMHAYFREKRNGIDYIITGCSEAYPVGPASERGCPYYVPAAVDDRNYGVRVYRVDE